MIQFPSREDTGQLSGEHITQMSDLCDRFIRDNTPYSSLRDLLKAGGFKVETREDLAAIPDDAIDAHIANNTRFNNLHDLIQTLLREQFMGG